MIFNHIFISLILCTFVQFNFFTGWFLELFYLTRFDPVDFQKQKVNWSTPDYFNHKSWQPQGSPEGLQSQTFVIGPVTEEEIVRLGPGSPHRHSCRGGGGKASLDTGDS